MHRNTEVGGRGLQRRSTSTFFPTTNVFFCSATVFLFFIFFILFRPTIFDMVIAQRLMTEARSLGQFSVRRDDWPSEGMCVCAWCHGVGDQMWGSATKFLFFLACGYTNVLFRPVCFYFDQRFSICNRRPTKRTVKACAKI